MTGDPDTVVAVWTESTWCGTRYETLTADGQVHVDGRPPLGEPWFEGEDAPDYNPICGCPCLPKQFVASAVLGAKSGRA
ncbi:hypothetical protein SAMN04487983_104281 [Streptomyces sp. yr375]|uniref:hypothetical protein n=1 Tax=Streptomyces sp. yr375 TaxID=1761906 RepID=UPI0008C5C077|nr:hypothetical protein [Streptomyces sp. yr375]SES32309.1 hypothetical protein SAMN04487983_104281 [Streptomyces sp. yr375]